MNFKELNPYPLLGKDRNKSIFQPVDLSIKGKFYKNLISDTWEEAFETYADKQNKVLYGGYLEERFFYLNEDLFGKGKQRRKYHLGIDLWTDALTDVFCPIDAKVYSLSYNAAHLDYGNTIILRHNIAGISLFSLYGHLSSEHLESLEVDMEIKKGQKLCTTGAYAENGHWPPHLHFQLIKDLGPYKGDYPGVSSEADLTFYKNNCPDPIAFVLP